MAIALNPYLNFRGTAREAMEFYRDVFGGEFRVMRFAEYAVSDDPAEADPVMHADLVGDHGIRFMAADVPARMAFEPGATMSMSLSGDDEARLRRAFTRLAEGGTVTEPLAASPWGDVFGMCTDRFGVPWLVNIAAPGGAAG